MFTPISEFHMLTIPSPKDCSRVLLISIRSRSGLTLDGFRHELLLLYSEMKRKESKILNTSSYLARSDAGCECWHMVLE